jgi:sialate O-acetylesterase
MEFVENGDVHEEQMGGNIKKGMKIRLMRKKAWIIAIGSGLVLMSQWASARIIYSNDFKAVEFKATGVGASAYNLAEISAGRLVPTATSGNLSGFRVDLTALGLATDPNVTAVQVTITGKAPLNADGANYLGLAFQTGSSYNVNDFGNPVIGIEGNGYLKAAGGAGFVTTANVLPRVNLAANFTSGAEFTMSLCYNKSGTIDTWYNGVQIHTNQAIDSTAAPLLSYATVAFRTLSFPNGVNLDTITIEAIPEPAVLSIDPIFNDGAVLQCDMPVNVWGKADPGSTVTVTFSPSSDSENAEQEKTTVANPEGKWQVQLDPMSRSSEAHVLTVRSSLATRHVTISNVVVGEVWLASGQSNMLFPLAESYGGDVFLDKTIPDIRFVRVPTGDTLPPVGMSSVQLAWNVFTPPQNLAISGVAFYFTRMLQGKVGGPIGVILSAVGGTPCEAWTPLWALEGKPELKHYADRVESGITSGTREPTVLYENMIAPLVPYTARGVIWYQGEGNAFNPDEYKVLFPSMIEAWRKAWDRPDWPFLFVQLATYGGRLHNDWAGLRAAQTFTRDTVPHTGMALAIDYGDKEDIHPRAKQPVGERLARLALDQVYGRSIASRGPAFQKLERKSSGVHVVFQHTEAGLETSDGNQDVPGFEVAGADGEFYPAQASIISKSTVGLTCAEVKQPVTVRYAWHNWIEPPVTLQNSEGLPAEPFLDSVQKGVLYISF